MTCRSCGLSDLGLVRLGYKSLQNAFFYLSKKKISEFGIEKRFLKSLFRMSDMDSDAFLQTSKPGQELFYCSHKESDLRGTGSLRYIRAMANRPATAKKQSGKAQTISQALVAQGGKYWYAPKAVPHKSHIWIRKAFDSVYSPFLFEEEAALDQRCNLVKPRAGIGWECLAGVLSSHLFALALESTGGASMGAGALELPTKKLRTIRVVDVRLMSPGEKKELVRLARDVWKHERPIDWRDELNPGPHQRALDEWLLLWTGADLTLARLYVDLAATCRARLRLAEDKRAKVKKSTKQDIDSIARTIADDIRPLLEARRFPEAFFPSTSSSIPFQFADTNSLVVDVESMMSEAAIRVRDASSGQVLLDKNYSRNVTQVILRSLLMGRKKFSVPAEESVATGALDRWFKWFPPIFLRVEEGCRSAAVGTKFEEQVRGTVLRMLELDQRLAEKELFGEFNLL